MATNATPYNLDDGISEYFEFILKGHTYQFKYLTTDEMQELMKVEQSDEAIKNFFSRFITKTDPASPEFADIAGQMTIPQLVRFREMVTKEMNPVESNQSPENS